MNNRERTYNILHYKKVDRLPAVHFGYWEELLVEWAEQGHIDMELALSWGDGNDADKEIDKKIGWDYNWVKCKGADIRLRPWFEEKVLEVLPDGFERVQDKWGIIVRKKQGAKGIPGEDDYQLKDRKAWEELYKPKMQFTPDRIPTEYLKNYDITAEDRPVGITVGSVLGNVRNLLSLVGMSYMMYDDYELLAEIIDTYAEMQYKCVEVVLETGIKFDYAHYWEDICFKNGPLLSPVMFEELCAKHYKKRNDLCKKHGIDVITLDCDGVVEKLLPVWFENGVNTMFPIEVGTWGDQFTPAREKFGKGMLGIGGMDKTVLLKDKKAVDDEIERIKRLVDLGGYIPCPDHRLMPGTKWDLTLYYAEQIKKIKV